MIKETTNMRLRTIPAIALLLACQLGTAQERNPAKGINRWSIEYNSGANTPLHPFTEGYEAKGLNMQPGSHFDIGGRYMLSDKFGLKLDVAYDRFKNCNNQGPLPFDVRQFRIGLQGVVNAGRFLELQSCSERLGLLLHAGVHLTSRKPVKGPHAHSGEADGGLLVGLTPQFKINRRLAVMADFSLVANFQQHYTWDGMSVAAPRSGNLAGQMLNTSIGLIFYPGKHQEHADWQVSKSTRSDRAVGLQQLDEIEAQRLNTI